jgi:hypothetical protein
MFVLQDVHGTVLEYSEFDNLSVSRFISLAGLMTPEIYWTHDYRGYGMYDMRFNVHTLQFYYRRFFHDNWVLIKPYVYCKPKKIERKLPSWF